jgi:hypothetical protein
MSSLIKQPNDIIFNICQYIDFRDVLCLKQTAKRFSKVDTYNKNILQQSENNYKKYRYLYLQNLKRNLQKNIFKKIYNRNYSLISEYFKVLNKFKDCTLTWEYDGYDYTFDLETHNYKIRPTSDQESICYVENIKNIDCMEFYIQSLLEELTCESILPYDDDKNIESDEKNNYLRQYVRKSFFLKYDVDNISESQLELDENTEFDSDTQVELKVDLHDKNIKPDLIKKKTYKYFLRNSKELYLKYKNIYAEDLKKNMIITQDYYDISLYFSLLEGFSEYKIEDLCGYVFELSTYNESKESTKDVEFLKIIQEITGKPIKQVYHDNNPTYYCKKNGYVRFFEDTDN